MSRCSSGENKENVPPPGMYNKNKSRAKVPQLATTSSKNQENLSEDIAGACVEPTKRRSSSTSSMPRNFMLNTKLVYTNLTINSYVKKEIDSILKPQEPIKIYSEFHASSTSSTFTSSTQYPKSASCVSTTKFNFDFAKVVVKQEVAKSANRRRSTNRDVQNGTSRASSTSPCKGKSNADAKAKFVVYEDKAKASKALKPLERYMQFENVIIGRRENKAGLNLWLPKLRRNGQSSSTIEGSLDAVAEDLVRKAEKKKARLVPKSNNQPLCPNQNLPPLTVNCLKRSIPDDKHSPILPNAFTFEYVLISQKLEKLRKPKVKERVSGINSIHMLSLPFVGDAYNEEYLEDIFNNIRLLEKKMVLGNNYLGNNDANANCRTKIVNWLMKLQAELKFSESEFYIAVYLLDRTLATVPVAINMYQLVIAASLWIASKHIGSHSLKASTIISYCGNAYLIQQLMEMERKILKIVEFQVPTIEPSMCINYYLKLFNLHKNDVAKLSAFYIVDCFSLLQEFSSIAVSILAAASVNFALNTYYEDERDRVNGIFRDIFSDEELGEIRCVETTVSKQLGNMGDVNYAYKEPYVKYSGHKTMLKVMDFKK